MSPYDAYQPFCNDDAVSIAKTQNTQKKPRHRHSPHQLAALNELFELNEHPPLEQRSALADRLGMETKTVNAWFQNKRASSKKRVRGGVGSHDSRQANKHISSAQQQDVERLETENALDDLGESPSGPTVQPVSSKYNVPPASRHPAGHHEGLSHDPRQRLSEDQLEGLKKLFNVNPHPTPEDRHALSASLGMTYDKVTNWFQNQRYQAKKKKEDEEEALWHASQIETSVDPRQYPAIRPSYPHPSLSLPPPTNHPLVGQYSAVRRSPSITPSVEDRSPRRTSSRVGSTPYRNTHSTFTRTRRSRPEPFQLEALKRLFRKTATPTIEERFALALEVGMDVGKVTNWFRNLRQTARRRAKKSGSGDDDDDDFHPQNPYSASSSVSRSGSPSLGSPELFIKGEVMMDFDDHRLAHSIDNSEDEYPVTPPPEPSPSPPLPTVSSQVIREMLLGHLPYPIEIDKASAERFPGIRIEDALLLLSFHHHTVHY